MAEEKKREAEIKAVWFAAGTAALMACLERFIFLSSVITHWRMWVFLALNLLLLAILFTSTMQATPSNEVGKEAANGVGEFKDEEENKRQKNCRQFVSHVIGTECANNLPKREGLCLKIAAEDEEDEYGKEGSFELSKEELNERVEAFIKMFRQQYLVSDAKSRSCRFGSWGSTSENISAKRILVNPSNIYI